MQSGWLKHRYLLLTVLEVRSQDYSTSMVGFWWGMAYPVFCCCNKIWPRQFKEERGCVGLEF